MFNTKQLYIKGLLSFIFKYSLFYATTEFNKYQDYVPHFTYFNKYKVSEINPRNIDAWIEHLKRPSYLAAQHKSRLSYKKVLDLLNQVLGYYSEYICENTGYFNPIKKRHRQDCIVDKVAYEMKKAKKKDKYLPRSVFKVFLNQMRLRAEANPSKEEVFFILALFQFSTGVRVGEVAALKWEDVNFVDNTAYIRRTVYWKRRKGMKTTINDVTKNFENRNVYLTTEIANQLKKWSLKSGRSQGLVFSFDGKAPLEYRSIQYRYDKVSKKIGNEWTGTHIARHSFATDFLSKTKNSKALQSILGHKSSKQTDSYAKITEELTRDGIAVYQESFSDIADAIEI